MKLTEADKIAIRAEAAKCEGVSFRETPGQLATYPSSDGFGGDFFDVPVVLIRPQGEGTIARMVDGAFALLPRSFPVERVSRDDFDRTTTEHEQRKAAKK
jgi:hypothetical protein